MNSEPGVVKAASPGRASGTAAREARAANEER